MQTNKQASKPECDFCENLDKNEYPNIFESTNLHERISEYIHNKKFDTNKCLEKLFLLKIVRIFKYI